MTPGGPSGKVWTMTNATNTNPAPGHNREENTMDNFSNNGNETTRIHEVNGEAPSGDDAPMADGTPTAGDFTMDEVDEMLAEFGITDPEDDDDDPTPTTPAPAVALVAEAEAKAKDIEHAYFLHQPEGYTVAAEMQADWNKAEAEAEAQTEAQTETAWAEHGAEAGATLDSLDAIVQGIGRLVEEIEDIEAGRKTVCLVDGPYLNKLVSIEHPIGPHFTDPDPSDNLAGLAAILRAGGWA